MFVNPSDDEAGAVLQTTFCSQFKFDGKIALL